MKRLAQFFEGDNCRLSMTRLMVFLSFWPATWVVVKDGESETLGWFLSAYVVTYGAGKVADIFTKGPTNGTTVHSTESVQVVSTSRSDGGDGGSDLEDSRLEKRRPSTKSKKRRAF